ncbi:MAG: calcium/sodium antiporter [Leptospiraceae bacterium]|nr:calcium/sodium antiporter [Leptospiraceae bacterium]
MEELIVSLIHPLPTLGLLGIILGSILILGKGADMLVEEAVVLSIHWGIPKMIIGATIISLGTTLPEVTVSVFAAISGNPEIALGNAVGSIICDTGLILGIAILISPPDIDRNLVNRQGLIQFAAGILLVLACIPYNNITSLFTTGGNLSQFTGYIFLILLGVYLFFSVKLSRAPGNKSQLDDEIEEVLEEEKGSSLVWVFLKLILGVFLVIASSKILIPAVQETALRMDIPESIIGATLVAFGTSLPELVTSVTAARKGHSELALGNIIGADILNVLFVSGAAAAVTPAGLSAPGSFFLFFFPAMIFVLFVFRIAVMFSDKQIGRPYGVVLLLAYLLVTVLSYFQ